MPIEPPLPLLPAAAYAIRALRVGLSAVVVFIPNRPEYSAIRDDMHAAGELLGSAVARLERPAVRL